jgi:holo-[acyl-carrier protein] synthase
MIVGLGLDVVDVERFAGLVERHGEALLRRVYRQGEIRIGGGRARAAHLAGLFAAKEAALKALGTGWSAGVAFRQVEICRAGGGAPELRFHERASERAAELGVESARLSISHDGRFAAAVVVLESAAPGRDA